MLTKPHDPLNNQPDPRLERAPLRAVRPFRPIEREPACSCGCKAPHEVARRRTYDGARLVVLSTGEARLFAPGDPGPIVVVHVDRFDDAVRRLMEWASVMSAADVARDLEAAHAARWASADVGAA